MTLLALFSFIIILGYIIVMISKTGGVPYSISDTYYSLSNRFWFGWAMISSGILLLPPAIEASAGKSWYFILLAVAGMIILGVCPNFRTCQKISHSTGAAISLVSSQIWVYYNNQVILLLWCLLTVYLLVSVKRHWTGNFISCLIKRKPMFWIEAISLLTVYITCIP